MDGEITDFLNRRREAQEGTLSYVATRGSNPDASARANVLARRLGLPPDAVERNLTEVETREQVSRARAMMERYPAIGTWASNPRHAAISRDDTHALGKVAGLFEKAVNDEANRRYWRRQTARYGSLTAPPLVEPTAGNFARGVGRNLVESFEGMRAGFGSIVADIFPDMEERNSAVPSLGDFRQENAQRAYERSAARMAGATPEFRTRTMRGVYSGVSSLAQMVPGMAASIATGNPAPALAAAGAQAGLPAYAKYRSRGAEPLEAAAGAAGEGGVEVATELIPMSFLVRRFGRAGFKPFVAGLLAREVPSEQVATFAQDAIDTATANPDKTWGEFLRERPDAAYDTLVATVVQSGLMGGASKVTSSATMKVTYLGGRA